MIHEKALKGFDAEAEAYERGRPGYSEEATNFLIERLNLRRGTLTVDLGAGTGKLTRALLGSGASVIAVEPVEAMRRQFESLLPGISILEGTAENLPFKDGSVDAVVVAQAFHWFDAARAPREIYRVLKPGGRLGLIWNARDESVAWVAKLTEIIDPYEGDTPRYRTMKWKRAFDETELFASLDLRTFRHVQKGDVETVVDRIVSISFIAALESSERRKVEEKVRRLVSGMGPVELPYRTDVYTCRKLDA